MRLDTTISLAALRKTRGGIFSPLKALSGKKEDRDWPYTAISKDHLELWEAAGLDSFDAAMRDGIYVVCLSPAQLGTLSRYLVENNLI